MENISHLRAQVGWSVDEAATELGISSDQLKSYEDGSGTPPPRIITALKTFVILRPTRDREPENISPELGDNSSQLEFLPQEEATKIPKIKISGTPRSKYERSGSFTDNMKLPVHRWYRYSAGFSAEWTKCVLEQHENAKNILDPFVGSGTVLIEAEKLEREAVGIEAHPLVSKIAQAKLAWRTDPDSFYELASEIGVLAKDCPAEVRLPPSKLLDRCFTDEANRQLAGLRLALEEHPSRDSDAWRLCWLAFLAIIRESSHVGTAQWQYVLPNRRKMNVATPNDAFEKKVTDYRFDMQKMRPYANSSAARVAAVDARVTTAVADGWADLVITSPPYANNYDYADATRLELAVLGEIERWSDLQERVRPSLVRACTQHVASQGEQFAQTLADHRLKAIAEELKKTAEVLNCVKEDKGGKKPYHLMITYYFYDLACVMHNLRRQVKRGGKMCFVVGDSAPYGVHVPVDRWLGELAISAGFKSYEFEKIRDRNTKWKNRKHRVPLHEGRLWIDA